MTKENKKLISCSSCGAEIAKNAKICPKCGSKNKKPFYKRAWFIAVVIVAAVAVFANIGGNDDKPATTEVSQTESNNISNSTESNETIEYTVCNVSELIKALENNALAAEKEYKDKYVELTGKLSTIDSDGSYISLSTETDEFLIGTVTCYIKNDEQLNRVLEMTTGDIVTLKGKIKSIGEVLGYSLDIDSIQ